MQTWRRDRSRLQMGRLNGEATGQADGRRRAGGRLSGRMGVGSSLTC